jgi:hypothetical protein
MFQILHFFMFTESFELATTACVLAGAASLLPATISGWVTWKRYYHGSRARIFRRKILVAILMLAVSIPEATWRVAAYSLGYAATGIAHFTFFGATTILIAGAVIEGYLGGQLAHH